ICFYFLPLLATRAVLGIVYTVLIHSISAYSHYLDRLFFFSFRFSTFLTFPPAKFVNFIYIYIYIYSLLRFLLLKSKNASLTIYYYYYRTVYLLKNI
ncbi:hypothetical protein CMEL01_01240, partial [Colletotrichum melonis]